MCEQGGCEVGRSYEVDSSVLYTNKLTRSATWTIAPMQGQLVSPSGNVGGLQGFSVYAKKLMFRHLSRPTYTA
jgi:hypothetical protein